jgi:anti-sigma B factor antagonist
VSALIVRVRTAPLPTLVTVAGEIDLLTAPQLRDEVRALPDGDVILDISGVQFLAAAGLRVLLDLHDRQARAGAQVVLAEATLPVQRVLSVTGLDHTLPVIATIDEAVAFVRSAPARTWSTDRRVIAMDGA